MFSYQRILFILLDLSFNNLSKEIMKVKLTLMLVATVAILAYSCGAPKKAKCEAYSAKNIQSNELASK
jgi:Tfp pilus assembly protein PilO